MHVIPLNYAIRQDCLMIEDVIGWNVKAESKLRQYVRAQSLSHTTGWLSSELLLTRMGLSQASISYSAMYLYFLVKFLDLGKAYNDFL